MSKHWNGLTVKSRNKYRRIDDDYSYFNALVKRASQIALRRLEKAYTEYYPYPNDPEVALKDFEDSLVELIYLPKNSTCQKMIAAFDRGYQVGLPLWKLLEEAASIISTGYEEIPSGNPREDELVVLHYPNAQVIFVYMVQVYSRRNIAALFQERKLAQPNALEVNPRAEILRLLNLCSSEEITDILQSVFIKIGWKGDLKQFTELLTELHEKYWIEKINPKTAQTLGATVEGINATSLYQYIRNPSQVYTTRYKSSFNNIKENPARLAR